MTRSVAFTLITSLLIAITLGTLLLMMPFASTISSLSFVDALFTSTSAVTVTGLIVRDTALDFTFAGQVIILLLLQFGGLGFMTFSTLIILMIGKSISMTDKFMIENVFTTGNYKNVRNLVRKIFLMTFTLELSGALILYTQLSPLTGHERLFSAVFHSISAFCNAGFSVFSNSFESYTSHLGINLTLAFLIIAGGLGFLVLNEIFLFLKRRIKIPSRFSLHTKLVLITSFLLILLGAAVIFIEEWLNPGNTLPAGSKLLSALFQSVSARTAGFNTITIPSLSIASVFILFILMFIGASPGSTGGGVKTSTVGMTLAYFRSRLKGREKVDLFYRNIPVKTVEKAFMIIILSSLIICISCLFISSFESRFTLNELLFEVISAFGTVGLSMGITPDLSPAAKIIITITMFIGRIGPLTFFIALSRRESRAVFNYAEENIMIG